MLRPHTAYSAYGIKKYFETADYYSQGNETVGQWGGKLANQWGLTGEVTKDPFGQLCDVLNPATGEQLTPRMNEHRRIGDDFVWSLPKDVGAWIMLLPPAERDAMLAMVERRVYQVMGMIEADVETRGEFEAAGSQPFVYMARDKPTTVSYWRLVAEAYDDADALKRWAGLGFAAAQRAAAKKAARSVRAKRR